MSILIATYPRSGSSYLQAYLSIFFSEYIDSTHLNKGNDAEDISKHSTIVTVVRNPIDSITSIVSMETHYNKEYRSMLINNSKMFKETICQKRIKEYADFYSKITDYATVFIDYEQLDKNIKVLANLLSKIENKKSSNNEYFDVVKDTPSQKFLRTSTKSELYNDIKNIIVESNLTSCNEVYEAARSLCLDLDLT